MFEDERGKQVDPDTALELLISAVVKGEWDSAESVLFDLRYWNERGGFLPRDPRASVG
jgi:hypothetical protein